MKEIGKRLAAPTPKFWKKFRLWCILIGGAATIVASGGLATPIVATVAGYVATAAGMGIGLASLTKEDGTIDLSKLTPDQLLKLRGLLFEKKELNEFERQLMKLLNEKIEGN